jgi:hypothetical protein
MEADPCISDLHPWNRRYWVDPERPHQLGFALAMADGKLVRPGVKIIPTFAGTKLFVTEGAPVKVALGFYDVPQRHLQVDLCGPNYR